MKKYEKIQCDLVKFDLEEVMVVSTAVNQVTLDYTEDIDNEWGQTMYASAIDLTK